LHGATTSAYDDRVNAHWGADLNWPLSDALREFDLSSSNLFGVNANLD
jgi:hypothetical protein